MDLSALTLTQLRYLVMVDRHRSFRGAAEHCHVSQPALSMQIQKLEEILGQAVFDRSTHPIVPTERGAPILEQARAILRECDRLEDIVRAESELAGPYRLGVLPTLGPTLVPRIVPAFVRAHPRVQLVIEELQTGPLLRALAEGMLDGGLAVTPLLAAGVKERPLYHEPFFVYLPAGHPLAQKDELRQSDLVDQQPWILADGHCFRHQVLHLCKVDRSTMSPRVESGSFETIIRLVDEGLGLTILPELVARELPPARWRERVRPFAPPVPVREVSFIHVREHLHRGIADALCAVLRAALPDPPRDPGGAVVLPPR
jgi:LysR family transcriptional regulator, hydrogen peroxide-inducible genes activator